MNYIHGQREGVINVNVAMKQLYKPTPKTAKITTTEDFLKDLGIKRK